MGIAELVATAAFALSEMEIDFDNYSDSRSQLHPAACIRRVSKLLTLITTTKRCPLAVRGRAFQALAFAIDCVVVQDGDDYDETRYDHKVQLEDELTERLLEDTAPSKAAAEELSKKSGPEEFAGVRDAARALLDAIEKAENYGGSEYDQDPTYAEQYPDDFRND
ncbi:hypothetical protein T492DRAFT_1131457 [Pavlovales sp. CCMP2436]|nr:hypothetical protein T492DRAFT_1131457 [Pavlovales sp. CCMP2436]